MKDEDDNDDMIIVKDDNEVDDEGNYSNSVCPSISHRDFGELFISNYERMSNLWKLHPKTVDVFFFLFLA